MYIKVKIAAIHTLDVMIKVAVQMTMVSMIPQNLT